MASAIEVAAKLVVVGTQRAIQERTDGQAETLVWTFDTPEELRVCVYAMAFGNGRLCIGPANWFVYDAGYCYDGVDNAIVAAAMWIVGGCQGEPEGWTRNLQTDEYRNPQ